MDFQAFLITLRECLEAVLIVGLILGYLDRLNAPQYKKWVYAGVGWHFSLALVSRSCSKSSLRVLRASEAIRISVSAS